MSHSKIIKSGGSLPSELEIAVANELVNLEASAAELKPDLQELKITAVKEVEVDGGRKAVVIFVPFRQAPLYHKIQIRLVRELEKKFSGKHVVFIAQRTILSTTALTIIPTVKALN